jgi:hypothetical protein
MLGQQLMGFAPVVGLAVVAMVGLFLRAKNKHAA